MYTRDGEDGIWLVYNEKYTRNINTFELRFVWMDKTEMQIRSVS